METPRGFMDDIHESEGGESVMEEMVVMKKISDRTVFERREWARGVRGGESEKTVWCLLG